MTPPLATAQHHIRVSLPAPSGAPLLQRRLAAAIAMLAAVVLAVEVSRGGLELLFLALVAWGLCLVGLVRAVLARRLVVAVLYALGAAPVTVALAVVALG